MSTVRKHTGRASSVPGGLAMGAVVSMAVTGGLTALLAGLLDREMMQWEMVGYGSLTVVMLSSFLGAVTACVKIRRQRMLVCLMAGMVYLGILLAMTALFFGGQYQAVGVTALLVLGGTMCAALTGAGKGRVRKKMSAGWNKR